MTASYGYIALFLYLLCALGLMLRIMGKPGFANHPIGYLLIPGFIAVLLHGFSLHGTLHTTDGLQFGFFNAASTVGAVNALLVLLVSLRRRTELLAIIVLPLTALSVLLELNFHGSHLLAADTASSIRIHVLVSIVAYSILGLAAVMAILLAMQNRLLHNHHPGGLLRHLPPLQIMEKLLFDFIVAGFIGLSLALISGFIFLENLFAQHLVHKTVLAIVAWLVFGILLGGRWLMGWRGKTAIRWTLSGFVALMLAYFGSKFVMEIVLR